MAPGAQYCRKCGLAVGPVHSYTQGEYIDCRIVGSIVFLTQQQAARGGRVRFRFAGTGDYADIHIEPGIASGTDKTICREYTDRYGVPNRELRHIKVIIEPQNKPHTGRPYGDRVYHNAYGDGAHSGAGMSGVASESRVWTAPAKPKKTGRKVRPVLLVILAVILLSCAAPWFREVKTAFVTQTFRERISIPETEVPVPSAEEVVPTVIPSAAPAIISEKPDVSAIPYYEDRFYINNLEEPLLFDVVALYKGISAFETEIKLKNTADEADLRLLINAIKYDCPELFQAAFDKKYTFWNTGGRITSVSVPYSMSKTTYDSRLAQCSALIAQLREDTTGFSAQEREQYVYDYFTNTVSYSTTTAQCGNASGAIVDKSAKCDGISLAMKWAMEAVGIPAIVLSGKDEGDPVGHAWNCVKINGSYCDVDLTNDLIREERSMKLYSAYNVKRDWISRLYPLSDDIVSYYRLPESSGMHNSYHVVNGSFVYSGDDIESAVHRLLDESLWRDGTGVIQFEDDADFSFFLYDGDVFFETWFYDNGYWGSYSLTVLHEYRTVGFRLNIN